MHASSSIIKNYVFRRAMWKTKIKDDAYRDLLRSISDLDVITVLKSPVIYAQLYDHVCMTN